MVAAAVIGSAVVGVAGSTISASKNKKAINKSTDAQLQAQREALAFQEKAFNQILPLQKSALDNSLGYQTGAYNAGGEAITSAYNNSSSALAPWMRTGYNANDALNDIAGLPRVGGYTPQAATFTPMTVPAIAPTTPAPGSPSTVPITQPVVGPMSYADAQAAALARLM